MNFFGHAHVAIERSADPAYVLGAMLPDFVSMGRVRLVTTEGALLSEGVALHHATDEAFHSAPEFVRICRVWGAELERRGLSWGGARAAAHVGAELLLDGLVLDHQATRAAYLEAIGAFAGELRRAIEVHGDLEAWDRVITRLSTHGTPEFYRSPDEVADRLILILADRPRLAIDPSLKAPLRDVMHAVLEDVRGAAPTLIEAARSPLSRPRQVARSSHTL